MMTWCNFIRPLVALALLSQQVTAPLRAQTMTNITEQVHRGAIHVAENKGQVLGSDKVFGRVLVGNPEIADILPITNRSVYVLGKALGSTSLTVYDSRGNLMSVLDLVVGPDISELRRQLVELVAGEPIAVRLANGSIVLTGVVSAGPSAARAMLLAESYAPGKVVNLMGVGASQQVMLEVRFAEMSRDTAKEIGVQISALGTSVGGQSGEPLVDAFGSLASVFRIGSVNVNARLDALERKGLVTTLAEPNLIALSGDTASFLAGGEFPIPVAQNVSDSGRSTITIEFKQFGVALAFTPTVLADGVINLEVAPEVSSIDPTVSIRLDNIVIPGLKTRRARTTLELRDGEAFAIAGLLRSDFRDTIRQIPMLGSIPILGSLFRSSKFEREDTELVIIVTPRMVKPVRPEQVRLPTDRVPSDTELFLLGREVSAKSTEPKPAAIPDGR